MSGYVERVTKVVVNRIGDALFEEWSTSIEIDDESGGEFLVVSQDCGKIKIDAEEWPAIRKAIDRMAKRLSRPSRTD